nr:MAG TPA: hypothetical protein [Caudoviricetes sp.]
MDTFTHYLVGDVNRRYIVAEFYTLSALNAKDIIKRMKLYGAKVEPCRVYKVSAYRVGEYYECYYFETDEKGDVLSEGGDVPLKP